jgi:G6PDH family F420-dependent oxidoreductase
MLEEAIEVIRAMWTGEEYSHRGRYYTVENARIYSVPDTPPNVLVSGFGPKATEVAARIGDGFVTTSASKDLVDTFRSGGGKGLVDGSLKVCWGPDERECAELAHRLWRTSGVPGELSQELRTPALFEQASSIVTVESMADSVPCGPDVDRIVEAAKEYAEAGFDRLYITQIGPAQAEFFQFFERELAAALADIGARPGRSVAA